MISALPKVEQGRFITKARGREKLNSIYQHYGVNEYVAQRAIQEIEADWFEAALKVKVKKFGAGRETDFKYAMKQKQFLQYRGFYSEHIEFAVKGE